MSKMKELYLKVSKDETLQEKVTTIMKDAEKAGEEATTEKLIAFAKDAGYDIKADEMQSFFKELAEKDNGELSESEMDMVAGGKGAGPQAFSLATMTYGCMIVSASKNIQPTHDNCYK